MALKPGIKIYGDKKSKNEDAAEIFRAFLKSKRVNISADPLYLLTH
jgi:hypothetical protein